MAVPYVRSIKPYDVKEIFGKLSQTNQYEVSFTQLNSEIVEHARTKFGVNRADDFMSRKGGLLCSDASLPSTSLATAEVKDNFMGVSQEYAHTRLYTDIDFTFYVDRDYTNLRIFEAWIDYISSGSSEEIDELSDNYYRRMRYPETYKVQSLYITKFERDFNQRIDYQFINAFPKLITAIPVSYGGADILKVNVSFNYDRYIINPKGTYKRSNAEQDLEDIRSRINARNARNAPKDGSAAAQEFFEENRASLFNDPRGSTFTYDPTRFGGGSVIEDSNSGFA